MLNAFDRRNLPKLLASQERARKNGWYSIRNLQDGEAEVFIYDVIGASWFDEGVEAGRFVKELRAIEADLIHLRVNTPGGDVFEALAIAEALDEHPATIWTHIDGVGASAGSWVGIRSEKTIMAPKSRLFIHDVWSIVIGNADDMRKEAALVDSMSDDIADMYAAKAGGSRQEWRDKMRAEMWFTDREAVDAGLADEIAEAPSGSGRAADKGFDTSILSIFRDTPRDLLNGPRSRTGGEKPSIRDAENALREAGFSRSEAKVMAKRVMNGVEPAAAVEASINELIGLMKG